MNRKIDNMAKIFFNNLKSIVDLAYYRKSLKIPTRNEK